MAPILSVSVRVCIILLRDRSWQRPAEKLADAAPHDPLLVRGGEPRQLLREQGDRLAVAARQAREIGTPEHPLRPEGIIDAPDVRVERAMRVGLGGITWKRRG